MSDECQFRSMRKAPHLIVESGYEFVVIFIGLFFSSNILLRLFGLDNIVMFYVVGFSCSIYATYLKYKVETDPYFKSSCNCVRPGADVSTVMLSNVVSVLSHKKGSILFGIPNSALGILFYGGLFLLRVGIIGVDSWFWIWPFTMFSVNGLLLTACVVSCVLGLYLWYTMVYEIGTICILCMTIHATNFITLLYLVTAVN